MAEENFIGIRDVRRVAGVTLVEMSAATGIPVADLSKFERGIIAPDRASIDTIARVYACDSDALLAESAHVATRSVVGEGYVTAVPKDSFLTDRRKPADATLIPMVDLFCGTGGFSHGFENTDAFQVVAGLDLLPDRIGTFAANHEAAVAACADIRTLSVESLLGGSPTPEIVIGGPPCQGFSSIRPYRSELENDSRNTLLEQYAFIVKSVQPRWFVMENVVGLLTHRGGKDLAAVLDLFASIGYTTTWRVLNAANYGLPQRRERLFVVGNRMGRTFAWPSPTHRVDSKGMAGRRNSISVEDFEKLQSGLPAALSVMDAIGDLPPIASGQSASDYVLEPQNEYQKRMRNHSRVLTMHEATRHSDKMLEIIRLAGNSRAALPEGMTTSGFSSCYSRLEPELPAVTLTVNFVNPGSNKCIHPFQDRALTPREGARLQGFEDDYVFNGSRTQVVKQIGNAVPPVLGRAIADALLEQW